MYWLAWYSLLFWLVLFLGCITGEDKPKVRILGIVLVFPCIIFLVKYLELL